MPTCAEVLARTLREAGVSRMFGLPGGEILDFIEAGRREGIEFVLTRDEGTASFMADVTGQIERRPGVCVSTLGPGAINMTLGVANAYLDRSPLIAVTAAMSTAAAPLATHQNIDLNEVYRPFTKMTITLDGTDTAAKVRHAYRAALEPRMGPVHIALPSNIAGTMDIATEEASAFSLDVPVAPSPSPADIDRVTGFIRGARRPALILGLDLDPYANIDAVRAFVDHLGVPTFATPKAKGILPEDHPLFFGVCAGVAGDHLIVELLERADLLVGLGFEPVESDKLWHHTLKLISLGPVSIAAREYQPLFEVVADVNETLAALQKERFEPFGWSAGELAAFRKEMLNTLRPAHRPGDTRRGLSPYEVTRRLRQLFPGDTILATDVGAIKSVTSQAWTAFDGLTFFESNGLSAMGYGFAAAMAVRLLFPERPVLCTIGDGGFGMMLAEIETCVRHRIHFVTVVYNDSALSLIQVSQENKGYPSCGVEYGSIDFAGACEALGAWARRVESMDDLAAAIAAAAHVDRPVVLDVLIDPVEYRAHAGAAAARVPAERA